MSSLEFFEQLLDKNPSVAMDFLAPRMDEWGFPTYYAAALAGDPNGRDGEWHAVITMTHEVVEYDGYGVPVFEGDVERIEWERARSRNLEPCHT